MKATEVTPYPRIMSQMFTAPWDMLPSAHDAIATALLAHIENPSAISYTESRQRRRRGERFNLDVDISEDGRIAVMSIEGMLGKKLSWIETWCGGVDLLHVDQDLEELSRDSRIETVILDLESPGGMARPSSDTAQRIVELASDKRVVAYTDGMMASAAYKLGAACDKIYASKSADVGCIGTYIALVDRSRQWEKAGLELKLFRDGKYKAMGHPGKALTTEEKEFLEGEVADLSKRFKDFVKDNRKGIEESALEGQTLSGSAAKKSGLIDGFYRDLSSLVAAEIKRCLTY